MCSCCVNDQPARRAGLSVYVPVPLFIRWARPDCHPTQRRVVLHSSFPGRSEDEGDDEGDKR